MTRSHLNDIEETVDTIAEELSWLSARHLRDAVTQYIDAAEDGEAEPLYNDNAPTVRIVPTKAWFPEDHNIHQKRIDGAVINPRVRTVHAIHGGCQYGSEIEGYIKPVGQIRGIGTRSFPFYIYVRSSGGHWVKAWKHQPSDPVRFLTDQTPSESSWADGLSGKEALESRASRLVQAFDGQAEALEHYL